MTTSIRILTVNTLDSSPSILLTCPNGNKILVNCGEGCQRSFLESTGSRVKSVKRVCLTHTSHSAVGGLPGMVLTTADVVEAAMVMAKTASMSKMNDNDKSPSNGDSTQTHREPETTSVANGATKTAVAPHSHSNKRKGTPIRRVDTNNLHMPGLDIVGPRGALKFIKSLRHFMRRDRFQLHVLEGEGSYPPREEQPQPVKPLGKKRGRKNQSNDQPVQGFHIQTIPCIHRLTNTQQEANENNNANMKQVEVMSFVFTTPPIQGKFLPNKAREMGIPPGPLYGQLKRGESISFVHPKTMETVRVESHEVVQKGSPGVAAAVLYCPSIHVWKQLVKSPVLVKLLTPNEKNAKEDQSIFEVIIHMAPWAVFHTNEYQQWIQQSLPKSIKNIFMEAPESLVDMHSGSVTGKSPFQAAALQAMTRSLLHDQLFPSLAANQDKNLQKASTAGLEGASPATADIVTARPMMEYILIPRAKRGFVEESDTSDSSKEEQGEIYKLANESGALDMAKTILKQNDTTNQTDTAGELIFTGTGSAIPCKHRNVTGMYVQMRNGNSILLDAGEGTLGQLLRTKKPDHGSGNINHDNQDSTEDLGFAHGLIRNIKAVWISHPHADHHLGLLRFLTERNAICGNGVDPVILMAPPNMFRFLQEYSTVEPRIQNSYIPFDCRDMVIEKQQRRRDARLRGKLFQDLGITNCVSVPVAHCPHSYGVVMDGTAFGRLSYSGDCRPSTTFADIGVNTDLLIHEATFEDGMEEEAIVKRHCTVGEALGVARRMNAKAVVLTHFSQRYPRIPPLATDKTGDSVSMANEMAPTATAETEATNKNGNVPVVFAFDFMTLTPRNLKTASELTPALRLLYPGDDKTDGPNEGETEQGDFVEPSAKEVLSVPGLFAQEGIL